ncbi:tetratricopeptide repeat protein [Chamaesiphon polymorphus]|uniref:Uncharacterized protein n=1 Tax=Chamaesiphon polymorphus CCALA 037 TaxID=2107692 RepID=A0A2T1G288_9CYAN|nr:tetratricopeptide repeat protein [Chamaesiphon polymorphus]PSB51358.1 hypothetical protein C7B77_21670 [Chamaesiphon polymorphus CCALA 037]
MQTSINPEALDRAWFLLQNNRFDRSEQEIRKHLSENPDDAFAHALLATCLVDLSRHSEAIKSAEQAISIEPDNGRMYWTLGCIYIRLRNGDLAEKYLLEAICLEPENPYFHASLSELCWKRSDDSKLSYEKKKNFLEQGSKAGRKGLEIEPNHFCSRLYLIKNLLALDDKNRIAEAINLAEELLSLNPESAAAHEVYAQALCCKSSRIKYTKQDLNRILSILQESLRLDPNRPYAKFLACHLLEWHYSILSIKGAWLRTFLKFVNIAAIPLLVLTLYFYNVNGFQIYSTGIFALLTLISLIPIIDLTQSQLRIYFSIQYRKFSQSNKAIDLFRWIIAIIATIGLSWRYLPIFIIKILTLLLWLCLPVVVIVLFFLTGRLINKN